jgi:hypothetical protein
MLDVLSRTEDKAKAAANLIDYDISYIPGVTEDMDLYNVSNEALGVSCYGPTKEKAMISAKNEAVAQLMGHSSLIYKIFELRRRKSVKSN